MKTVISIPNALFEQAKRLAESLEVSRDQLYARAIAEYIEQQTSLAVRQKLAKVYGELDSNLDRGLTVLQSQSLPSEEW